MSEIINPPPGGPAAPEGAASQPAEISNPPLDNGSEDVPLDEHLNQDPKVLPGGAGQKSGPGTGPRIENPPPWEAATPAAPEHEAPPLPPLNPPATGSPSKAATKAKPAKTKRRTPATKTRK
jgi:hypothetical protein